MESKIKNMDVAKYLSPNERKILKILNKSSNKLSREYQKQNNFFNLSLHTISKRWGNVMKNIIKDLTIFLQDFQENYSLYFNDIDNTSSWINGTTNILKDVIFIFVRDDRSIYFGITLIILSILIYILQISS